MCEDSAYKINKNPRESLESNGNNGSLGNIGRLWRFGLPIPKDPNAPKAPH